MESCHSYNQGLIVIILKKSTNSFPKSNSAELKVLFNNTKFFNNTSSINGPIVWTESVYPLNINSTFDK
jgi:hypothetical protein